MSYWRTEAKRAINHALKKSGAIGPGGELLVTPSEAKKIIRDAYPFPGMGSHPYQMWLKERKLKLYELGIGPKPKTRTYPAPRPKTDPGSTTPGQLSLFT